jgi:penicillin-binding protein 1A
MSLRATPHPPLRAAGRPAASGTRASSRAQKGGTTRRRTAAPKPKRRSWKWRIIRWSASFAFLLFVALAATLAWFSTDLPDTRRVVLPERRPAFLVVAADGAAIARYGDMTGDVVSANDLPKHLVDAVLAIEDRRFRSHFGLDPIGIARALWVNWQAGRPVQGGSTITQQAAKNLFLTPDRTLRRKIQEAILAAWLEVNYSKDQILTAYLNRVYFGAGTYGIDAAARAYFGIPATEVNLRQAAILAGLLKAPSRFSPQRDMEAAIARADVVLDAMVDAGFLTAEERAAADRGPPLPRRRPAGGADSRYFADWVADQVPDYVNTGPATLRIETTLEPALQRAAERTVRQHIEAEGAETGATQAALVAMRPDGAVVAMVGGLDYGTSQFNRAVAAQRQPGSAFKTFAYLAAIEQGATPDSRVLDAPIEIGGWAPRNFDEKFHGDVSAREALAKSYNSAAIRMLQRAGITHTIELAQRMGIASPLRPELSLALGTSEVNLLELTGAYAVLANRGLGVWPYGIRRIGPPQGTMLYDRFGGGPGETVLPWHVADIDRMLRAVVTEGTGRAAALDDRPVAGKTGTSQGFRDGWFIGFSADWVVGVWVGNDDGTPMKKVTGGGLPARIWHDFMAEASRGLPARPLPGVGDREPAPTTVLAAPVRPAVPPPAVVDQPGLDGLVGSLIDG